MTAARTSTVDSHLHLENKQRYVSPVRVNRHSTALPAMSNHILHGRGLAAADLCLGAAHSQSDKDLHITSQPCKEKQR